ncbi:MAG: guanylate kinase [Alphaproteobacteria bacterium]|nr:guanylate kinase [Alphaproteobacteria bacterium]MDD9919099.1 guanylate kinase [Alphaproteobacteria bacterium]
MAQPIPTNRILFTLTGPSGVGKDSIIRGVLEQDTKLNFLTTCVTRDPRPGEVDGQDYFFLTKDSFRQGIEMGIFLEYDEHYENYYGTRRQEVANVFKDNKDAVTDLNWPGVAQASSQMPENLVSILVLPPSLTQLEQRLLRRSSEGGSPVSAERFGKIREDILHMDDPAYVFTNPDMIGSTLRRYNHVITNDNLDQAIQDTLKVMNLEREKRRVS